MVGWEIWKTVEEYRNVPSTATVSYIKMLLNQHISIWYSISNNRYSKEKIFYTEVNKIE